MGRRTLVFRGRAFKGNRHRHSAYFGRGQHGGGVSGESARRASGCGAKLRGLAAACFHWPAGMPITTPKPGFLFGNPEYLRYNAEATLTPLRILAAFGHRILHLTAHMNLFVPVLMAFAALLLDSSPRRGRPRPRHALAVRRTAAYLFLLLVNALFFSFLGGALAYPLSVAHVSAGAACWPLQCFTAACPTGTVSRSSAQRRFSRDCSSIRPMDSRRKTIWLTRMLCACIRRRSRNSPSSIPAPTVLTAWPMTDELTKPELGYVKQPWDVLAPSTISAASQIERAAQEPQKYSVALVFSTKYDPPSQLLYLGGEALDERYFGLHHDLPPDRIAHQLGGTLVWRRDNDGMWIALIRFEHPVEARLRERSICRFAQTGALNCCHGR